jgi:MFS family permease
MAGALTELRPLATTVYLPSVLFGIAQGAITPVVALSAVDLGASAAVAAFVVSVMGIGKIVGDVPAGWLAGRVGEHRAMLAASALFVAGVAGCLLAPTVLVLALAAGVTGAGTSAFGIARQAYVTDVVPDEVRGRALSMLGGTMRIGLFAGPFLGALVMSRLGTDGGYWLGLVTAVIAAVVLLVVTGGDSGRPSDHNGSADTASPGAGESVSGLRTVRETRRVLLTLGVGALLIGAVRASRQVALPLWGDHIGLDPATTSLIFGLSGAMEMLLFLPGGMVMDRFGRRWVAIPACLILGLSLVLMPLTHSALTLGGAALLMGVGNGIGSGINMTIGSDVSPAAGRAQFLGIWRIFADVGNGVGPVVVGAVAAISTLGVGILAAGALSGVAAVVMARWLPARPRPSLPPNPPAVSSSEGLREPG